MLYISFHHESFSEKMMSYLTASTADKLLLGLLNPFFHNVAKWSDKLGQTIVRQKSFGVHRARFLNKRLTILQHHKRKG